MGYTVLVVEDLTIRYGGAVAVDCLCLQVRAGEIYGLLGPNGSGKSSTLAAIAGTILPAAGAIRVLGRERAQDRRAFQTQLGVVSQELALYEELSAQDNLTLFAGLFGLHGRAGRKRVAEVLQTLHLGEQADRRVSTLSGGMQRRLNLGCAILHRPALLLLDEPTVGLDIGSREAIFDALRELRDQGTALVFTSHHLEEAETLCDRLGLMSRGRLVAEGTLDELADGLELTSSRPRLERVFLSFTGGPPRP